MASDDDDSVESLEPYVKNASVKYPNIFYFKRVVYDPKTTNDTDMALGFKDRPIVDFEDFVRDQEDLAKRVKAFKKSRKKLVETQQAMEALWVQMDAAVKTASEAIKDIEEIKKNMLSTMDENLREKLEKEMLMLQEGNESHDKQGKEKEERKKEQEDQEEVNKPKEQKQREEEIEKMENKEVKEKKKTEKKEEMQKEKLKEGQREEEEKNEPIASTSQKSEKKPAKKSKSTK